MTTRTSSTSTTGAGGGSAVVAFTAGRTAAGAAAPPRKRSVRAQQAVGAAPGARAPRTARPKAPKNPDRLLAKDAKSLASGARAADKALAKAGYAENAGERMATRLVADHGETPRVRYDSPEQREAVERFMAEHTGKHEEWHQGFGPDGAPLNGLSGVRGGAQHAARAETLAERVLRGRFLDVHTHPPVGTLRGGGRRNVLGTAPSAGDFANWADRRVKAGIAIAPLGRGAVLYSVRPEAGHSWPRGTELRTRYNAIYSQTRAAHPDWLAGEVQYETARATARAFHLEFGYSLVPRLPE